jgi:thioredoxin 1
MAQKLNTVVNQNKRTGWIIAGFVALLLLGLFITGMSQWPGPANQANEPAIIAKGDNPVSDPEIRYLGLPTDPEGLALAEAGQGNQPTLVWFHADWCHVCQQIKPEVVNLGQEFEDKVKVVRLNVSDPASRAAMDRYDVRATPTFVLLDEAGQVRDNISGWPGYPAFVTAFNQLLTQL